MQIEYNNFAFMMFMTKPAEPLKSSKSMTSIYTFSLLSRVITAVGHSLILDFTEIRVYFSLTDITCTHMICMKMDIMIIKWY